MSEVIVIRCPMAKHEQLGVPRVPLKLGGRPNIASEKERDALVMQFLRAYDELRRSNGGPLLPTGVDPDWTLREVAAEQPDVAAGATLCLELGRSAPLVIPDAGAEHARRALNGVVALQSEVPMTPGAVPQAPVSPVLPVGAVPPPAVPGQPPAVPQASSGPIPDIRPAGCGGSACAIVNGVEAHDQATCPATDGAVSAAAMEQGDSAGAEVPINADVPADA